MTITVELDDGTATTLHEALTTHASTDHIAIYLSREDAELIIGFRGDRGMCYWHTSNADDDQVSTRGDNTEPVLYGWTEILIAAGSEIPRHDVLAAAREFAETGQQPAAISWMPYLQARSEWMPHRQRTSTTSSQAASLVAAADLIAAAVPRLVALLLVLGRIRVTEAAVFQGPHPSSCRAGCLHEYLYRALLPVAPRVLLGGRSHTSDWRHDTHLHVIKPGPFRERVQLLRHNALGVLAGRPYVDGARHHAGG